MTVPIAFRYPAYRYAIGSIAAGLAILALKSTGAIEPPATYILAILPFALMLAAFRALLRRGARGDCASPAAVRYTKGIMASSAAYIAGLGIALWIWRNLDPSIAVTWLLALLPILPIIWMIYVMARYIAEEEDEYLRHRAVMASLVGLAVLLAVASFWGFLETFELVPHVPGWWAVPIWALGMGLGQAWVNRREKAGEGE